MFIDRRSQGLAARLDGAAAHKLQRLRRRRRLRTRSPRRAHCPRLAPQDLAHPLAQLLTAGGRAALLQLQQVPALAGAAPDHRAVVVMGLAPVAVGGGLGVGHQPLDGDGACIPAPTAGHGGGLLAEGLELQGGGRNGPGIGAPAHAGAAQRNRIAVAPPGVGRQVHRVAVQPLHLAIAANNRVVEPAAHPGVSRRGPVQIDSGGHRRLFACLAPPSASQWMVKTRDWQRD